MPTNSSALALWMPQALALAGDEITISVPLHVVFGEAVDVARFFERHWKSEKDKDGNVVRPGFDTVANKKKGLTAKTGRSRAKSGPARPGPCRSRRRRGPRSRCATRCSPSFFRAWRWSGARRASSSAPRPRSSAR